MNTDRRRSNFLAALFGALVVALPLGGLAIGGAFDSTSTTVATAPQTAPTENDAPSAPSAPSAPARSATDVSALYERVSSGVVSVEVRSGSRGGGGR